MPLIEPYKETQVDSAIEPVTTTEAKTFIHEDLSDSANNTEIDLLISAARNWAEQYTGRTFITKTLAYAGEGVTGSEVRIPGLPIQSVASILYYNSAGTQVTWSSSEYQVDFYTGKLQPAPGYSWPTIQRRKGGIAISYTAGFGATAASVPPQIRLAIRLLVAHWYENRSAVFAGTMTEAPLAVKDLLFPFRAKEFP